MKSHNIKIPLAKPIVNKEMIEAAINALQNEKLVLGESVYKFEEEFAKYLGVDFAVSVNSGSTALLFTYLAIGANAKTSVITPSATFVSTMASATICGAHPVFSDVNLDTYTMDPLDASSKVREDTIAITPVHLYGHPADMERILELKEKKKLRIIEDCAQALGARYNGKKVGTFGDVAIFSFYPTKNITVCGDGGMIVTNDEKIAERVKILRDNGRVSKNTHVIPGYTARLNTINAAIGRVQLKYVDKWNEMRRKIAERYSRALKEIDGIIVPEESKGAYHVYHLYVIRVASEEIRNSLGAWLEKNGVQAAIHYPIPVHMQPIYREYNFSLPRTEEWARTILSLPIYPEMRNDEVDYVCNVIKELFEKELYKDNRLKLEGLEWKKKLT